ncbi:MAG: hypothetical protein D6726_07480 [Nitrospirae bacterium]|nr:MAG: hypothetical protein D6726_07480 [Nitrospirota bacterium]
MPVYRYTGYKPDGREVKGTITADAESEGILHLKESGIFIKEFREERGYESPPRFQLAPPTRTLPHFTRQLATLTGSSVPLAAALDSIRKEYRGYWHGVVSRIAERVREGASLSRALEEFPSLFPPYYRSMIAASEAGGNLREVLETLADFLETDQETRSRARTAMLYPAFMILTSVFVLSFVFTFVIPKIVRIFSESNTRLPAITKVLISLSYLFQHYWWAGLILAIGGVYLFKLFYKKNPLRIDKILLLLPVLRSLAYARFTATLGFLLRGGVPIITALDLSSEVTGNSYFASLIKGAKETITEGGSISESLKGLSPILLQIISTGERSGRLPELLIQASGAYKKDFMRETEQLTSILEPVIILGMGVVVGLIVFGVLLPIFELNQVIH